MLLLLGVTITIAYFSFSVFQDVTVTNDGATILKLLEVEHPAAKILCELADLQDQEVGDGTTSVVIIAAELLKGASELVRQKIHPTSIISGYRLACKYVRIQSSYSFDPGSESWKRSYQRSCMF